jgi:hypothetical protein
MIIAPVSKTLAASASSGKDRRRGGDASRTRVECQVAAIGFKAGKRKWIGQGGKPS